MQVRLHPAAVLKAIRDAHSVEFSQLRYCLGMDHLESYELGHILDDLERAGAITKESNRYCTTSTWLAFQNTLEISLAAVAEQDQVLALMPVFGKPRRVVKAADIFVLMPFQDRLKPVFEDHVSKVVRGLSCTVGRADDFFTTHAIIDDIWAGIFHSKAVVADCTGRNPNVFYEIGIAHTVGRPVVLITQDSADVPFDLRAIRYIEYSYTPPGMKLFEEKLHKTLSEILPAPGPLCSECGDLMTRKGSCYKCPKCGSTRGLEHASRGLARGFPDRTTPL